MTPEEKLLAAILPHLEQMTDAEIEAATAQTRAILAELERE